MRTLLFGLTLSAAALAGCASSVDAPMSSTFGQAVASMDSQIIAPTRISDDPPASSGARAAAAIARYEKGEVKNPAPAATSAVAITLAPASSGGK